MGFPSGARLGDGPMASIENWLCFFILNRLRRKPECAQSREDGKKSRPQRDLFGSFARVSSIAYRELALFCNFAVGAPKATSCPVTSTENWLCSFIWKKEDIARKRNRPSRVFGRNTVPASSDCEFVESCHTDPGRRTRGDAWSRGPVNTIIARRIRVEELLRR